jgi:hypothetical protein
MSVPGRRHRGRRAAACLNRWTAPRRSSARTGAAEQPTDARSSVSSTGPSRSANHSNTDRWAGGASAGGEHGVQVAVRQHHRCHFGLRGTVTPGAADGRQVVGDDGLHRRALCTAPRQEAGHGGVGAALQLLDEPTLGGGEHSGFDRGAQRRQPHPLGVAAKEARRKDRREGSAQRAAVVVRDESRQGKEVRRQQRIGIEDLRHRADDPGIQVGGVASCDDDPDGVPAADRNPYAGADVGGRPQILGDPVGQGIRSGARQGDVDEHRPMVDQRESFRARLRCAPWAGIGNRVGCVAAAGRLIPSHHGRDETGSR